MNKTKLLNGGQLYDIMINWEKRMRNEIPFLELHFQQLKDKVKPILEVGCGTGHHVLALTNKGFKVVGLDIDPSMITAAKEKVKGLNVELHVKDFLEFGTKDTNIEGFDGIFCLGNATGLIAQTKGYEVVINKFKDLLNANGTLIFQLLNMEKERNGWSNPTNKQTEHGEYIFIRGFKTTKDTLNPEILTLFRSKKNLNWKLLSVGSAKIPRISRKDMVKLLERESFGNISVYGSYQSEPFDPHHSTDMIFVCEKSK